MICSIIYGISLQYSVRSQDAQRNISSSHLEKLSSFQRSFAGQLRTSENIIFS